MTAIAEAIGVPHRAREADELETIIAKRDVRALYQPIVDLDTRQTVGWEALTRGPKGSALQFPDQLFGAAERLGRTAELDHCCQAAAIHGALDSQLGTAQELFINIEPDAVRVPAPAFLQRASDLAQTQLHVTIEITERELTSAPAELLALVSEYRRRGWRIAVDDVGADARSIALMPLLRPDVIKLDMAFVQDRLTRDRARVAHAVMAEAERSGAVILAEGIETEEQVQRAQALGASLGQGWHFGRPGELSPAATSSSPRRIEIQDESQGLTPYEYLRRHRPARIGTKSQLLQMSLALEEQARAQGESAVLLATFQEAEHFSSRTRERYEKLARSVAFVGALATGLGKEPAPGVRGSTIDVDDPLRQEWDVIVLGPHFAGAFVAQDLGDNGPDAERRFAYVVTHERSLVVAAAMALMARITPSV